MNFNQWQILECTRLGISPGQHSRLVEVAKTMGAAMEIPFGVAYEDLVAAINPHNQTTATDKAAQLPQD